MTRGQGHLVFGDHDAAVVVAERSASAREPLFSWLFLACDPMFDPLKQKPRFMALMKGLGAAPCAAAPRWPISTPSP